MAWAGFQRAGLGRLSIASWIGGGLMAWLLVWPAPYLPLMLAAAAAPIAALAMIGLGRGRVSLETWYQLEGDEAGRSSVLALWLLPAGAFGFRVLMDYRMLDLAPVGLAAAGLAAVFAGLAALVDARTRRRIIPFSVIVGLLWGWGVAVMANVELDRTPGRLRPAIVTEHYRPNRGEPTLVVSTLDGGLTDLTFHVDWDLYDATQEGDRVCLEDNRGLFGWRSVRLADCVGPPPALAQPPAAR